MFDHERSGEAPVYGDGGGFGGQAGKRTRTSRLAPAAQPAPAAPAAAPVVQAKAAPHEDPFSLHLLAEAPVTASGDIVQFYDSPHHVEIGDSVAGESVDIHGVVFTPGELAAITDYVGPADTLYEYEPDVLREMQRLLRAGIEDAAVWDPLTNGEYSKLAQANEDHFAPGGDGRDFVTQFVTYFAQALTTAQVKDDPEALGRARTQLYTAEHYLEDAFSSGHQIAAIDIEQAIDGTMSNAEWPLLLPLIASEVFRMQPDVIARYGWDLPGLDPNPIDTEAEFQLVASAGALTTGTGGIDDAMRKFVHEELDELGLEVSSLAHPTPWVIHGDHCLGDPTADNAITIAAIQAALTEVRATFEGSLATPVRDPHRTADTLMARHRPIPTPDSSRRIGEVLAEATKSETAIVHAVAEAMCATLKGTLDYAAELIPGFVCLDPEEAPVTPFPGIPGPGEPPPADAPVIGQPVENQPTYGGWLPDYPSLLP